MNMNNHIWFLIIEPGSALSKTWGAYRLNTLMKFKEMNVLSKCSK